MYIRARLFMARPLLGFFSRASSQRFFESRQTVMRLWVPIASPRSARVDIVVSARGVMAGRREDSAQSSTAKLPPAKPTYDRYIRRSLTGSASGTMLDAGEIVT